MPLPFQKYLGWLQRFYYQNPSGPIPFPTPVIPISHDWPLVPTTIAVPLYATIAGTVTTEFYAPAVGKHGLVVVAQLLGDAGAAIPATDSVSFVWDRNPSAAPGFQICNYTGLATAQMHFIGGKATIAAAATHFGVDPIYVPAGFRLVCVHTSVAGGVNVVGRLQVYELVDYQPLRLP